MEILITDVTEMSGDNYCVAGWDTTHKRMIRPLPGGGHWPQGLIRKHGVTPGAILRAAPTGAATGSFPHLTEDTPIDLTSIVTTQSTPNWIGAGAPDVSASVSEAFDDNLNGIRSSAEFTKGFMCQNQRSAVHWLQSTWARWTSLLRNRLVNFWQSSMTARTGINFQCRATFLRTRGETVVLQKQPLCFQIDRYFM
jgi:hypothetical protein